MGWFGKKYDPEQFVATLREAMLASTLPLALWHEAIRPNAAESARLEIAIFLLPLAISQTLTLRISDQSFLKALEAAHEKYLSYYKNGHEIVDAGSLIVWDIEKDSFCSVLRDKFFQPMTPPMLSGHGMRMSLLLQVAAQVRKELAVADLDQGIIRSKGSDPMEIRANIANMLANTFSKQIIEFNVFEYNFTQGEASRFLRSVKYAEVAIEASISIIYKDILG